jgi:hypothetical protein
VLADLEPVGDEYPTSVNVVLDSSGLNVIGFSSGWGDGAYPSWFGLDAGDRPVVVLTSFLILDGSTD